MINCKIWEIVYFCVALVLTVVGLVLCKKFCKSHKAQRICIWIWAFVYIVVMVVGRIANVRVGNQPTYLPFTVCAVLGCFLVICVLTLKKGSRTLEGATIVALLSNLAGLLYLTFCLDYIDFAEQLTSLLFHSLMVFMTLLLLIWGYVKPQLRHWYTAVQVWCYAVVYELFCLQYFGADNFINISILGDRSPYYFNWVHVGAALILGELAISSIYFAVDIRKNRKKLAALSIENAKQTPQKSETRKVAAIAPMSETQKPKIVTERKQNIKPSVGAQTKRNINPVVKSQNPKSVEERDKAKDAKTRSLLKTVGQKNKSRDSESKGNATTALAQDSKRPENTKSNKKLLDKIVEREQRKN